MEGLWAGIKGLAEAIWTLIKLPYTVSRFLTERLPALMTKYGPKLVEFMTEGGGITARWRWALPVARPP